MADFSTTVSIVDSFSGPLQAYQEQLSEATNVTGILTGAISETAGVMSSMGSAAVESVTEMIPALSDTAGSARDAAVALKDLVFSLDVSAVADFGRSIIGLTLNLANLAKSAARAMADIGTALFQMKNSKAFFALNFSTAITKRLVNTYKSAFNHINSMMSEHLDKINLEDKMNAMWGTAGKNANERMYGLANELGKKAGDVMNAAASAAAQGIGTDDFEDIYRFADKISKLNPGDDAGSIASSLVSNIKSGHDAETVSAMFGGGENMSRQLKRMGYERKLNRGDLQGALDIAKKVAEQAGYTEEKYQAASDTMSENFKYIHNVIGNIKERLGEIYTRHFEPVVKKIAKMMKSQAFQNFISAIELVIDRVGAAVGSMVEFLVDHWEILAAAVSAMFLAKGLIIGRMIGLVWKFKGVLFGAGKVVIGLIFKLKNLALAFLGLGGSMKSGLKALVTGAGKWVLIAGVVYGIVKLVQWLVNLTREEGEEEITLLGLLAGGYRFASNLFTNLFISIEHGINNIKQWFLEIKREFYQVYLFISGKISDLFKEYADKAKSFLKSGIGQIYLKGLGFDTDKLNVDKLVDIVVDQSEKNKNDAVVELAKINQEIADIERFETKYIDVMEGVEDAMQNPETVLTWLKDLFNLQKKTGEGVQTANKELRKFNEQEEELRWLKAFSDRQITSQYNQMTSYNRTVNINGMSQAGIAEMGRRSVTTRPSRAAM
jgi:hypothetical protein